MATDNLPCRNIFIAYKISIVENKKNETFYLKSTRSQQN